MSERYIEKGFIQIYTGEGKGKTTAALGLSLRAAGHGLRSIFIQFMKGWIDYGEIEGVKLLHPYVELHQWGRDTFVDPQNPQGEDIRLARSGFEFAKDVILEKKADIVILDEIICCVSFNLIKEEEVLQLMDQKPDGLELIMTGRGATKEMIRKADLVTEMKEVKHYYAEGIDARIGIER